MKTVVENTLPSSPSIETIYKVLSLNISQLIERFPSYFDEELFKILDLIRVNSCPNFLLSHPFVYLRKILLVQFFLQKKIVSTFSSLKISNENFFLKVFSKNSIISIGLISLTSNNFSKDQLLKIIRSLLPGINEVIGSNYFIHHPELQYMYCYLEIFKLRGNDLSFMDLKQFEKQLKQLLSGVPPLTPTLFWPYNEEESYRQIQILQREITAPSDIPHLTVHFQQQNAEVLEFLVHIVRPFKRSTIPEDLENLTDTLHYFCNFHRKQKKTFEIETAAVSIQILSKPFNQRGSVNLLYVRRFLLKHLEGVLGKFRDFNGGLFEKQQQHFEIIRLSLSNKIPYFDFFAEKLFYALHPVEMRFSLSLDEAEDLFFTFSKLLFENREAEVISNNCAVIKTVNPKNSINLNGISITSGEKITHARLSFCGFHYICIVTKNILSIKPNLFCIHKKKRTPLRLVFQEGELPSFNPYHSSSDMRSRILSKLLFEGLTRLNKDGCPKLTGASSVSSKSNIEYIFKLSPLQWSNGENITSLDYVKSWQNALLDKLSHPELLFIFKNALKYHQNRHQNQSLGIEALNPETLKIELEKPDPHFLHKLSNPCFFPFFGSFREPKWFNGPYLLREQNKEGLLLELNPYYPKIEDYFFDKIEVKFISNIHQIFELFNEGKIDWIGDPLSTLSLPLINNLQNKNKLKSLEVRRRFVLYYNTKHPFLSNSNLRRALSLSINRYKLSNEVFPAGASYYAQFFHVHNSRYFLQKAREELKQSNLPPLTITHSHQPGRKELAYELKTQWEETLGLKVHLEKMEWNLFRNKLEQGSFEIIVTIQDILNENSIEYLERFEVGSSWNFSQWNYQPYIELITKAKAANQSANQHQILLEVQKILEEEIPFTPLLNYVHFYAHNPNLKNFYFDSEGCVDFSKCYLEPG